MEYTSFYSDNFNKRLTEARRKVGITQSELAKRSGITQTSIAAYEQGRIKPRQKILNKIAYILKVTPDWLANGKDINVCVENWDNITPTIELKQIPLYSRYSDVENCITNSSIKDARNRQLHPSSLNNTNELFAMIINGDSMGIDNNLGFPDGSIVTFQQNFKFNSGGFYLVQVGNIFTFKQIFQDELKTRLHPLNINYPDSIFNNSECLILAKAVYVEINLDKSKPV